MCSDEKPAERKGGCPESRPWRARRGGGLHAAAVLLAAACLAGLPGCEASFEFCDINCSDVELREVLFSERFEDTSCEVCREMFFQIRQDVCLQEENPNCGCSYYCRRDRFKSF